MAILPVFLLLIGAALLWSFRRAQPRVAWALYAGLSLVTWGTTLGLFLTIPATTSLSVWRPQDLFLSELQLLLDAPGWQFAYVAVTVLLSVALTGAARPVGVPSSIRALLLVYTALTFVAVLANNLLTVAVSWALMDLVTFGVQLASSDDPRSSRQAVIRLGVDSAGVLLVLAAALAGLNAGGGVEFGGSQAATPRVALLSAAVLLRLGLLPLHFSAPSVPGGRRGIGTLLRLMPPAAALAALSRQFAQGIPEPLIPWLQVIGVTGAIIGGLRWALTRDALEARPFLVLGVSGVGVAAAGLNPETAQASILAAASLLLLSAAIPSLTALHVAWQRTAYWGAAALLAGLPFTPGGQLFSGLLAGIPDSGLSLAVFLSLAGLLILALGMVRHGGQAIVPWHASEDLVRLAYALGIFLPLLVAVGLGLRAGPRADLAAILAFFVLGGLSMALLFFLGRIPGRQLWRWERGAAWLDPSPLYRLVGLLYRRVTQLILRLGEILEGEAAFLWIFVLLLLAGLAVGR